METQTETAKSETTANTTEAEVKAEGATSEAPQAEVKTEVPQEEKKAGESTFVYPHHETISEEQVKVEELPKEIRMEIQGWNMLYKKNQKNPTKKLSDTLIKKSWVISEFITDWIERDLPEEQMETETKKEETMDVKTETTPQATENKTDEM